MMFVFPDVMQTLESGDVRSGGDKRHRGDQGRVEDAENEADERPGEEQNQAFGSLHDPHAAIDSEALGPGPGITHHGGAEEGGEYDPDGPVGPEMPGESHVHKKLGITVEAGIENGAEKAFSARVDGDFPVQDVAGPADQDEGQRPEGALEEVEEPHGRPGEESQEGQRIRMYVELDEDERETVEERQCFRDRDQWEESENPGSWLDHFSTDSPLIL